MFKCEWCNKEFKNNYALAGHKSHCKKNPLRNDDVYKQRQMHASNCGNIVRKEKSKKKQYSITCEKCGKNFSLWLTETTFKNGRFRKTCSRNCANSHVRNMDSKQQTHETMIHRMLNSGKYITYREAIKYGYLISNIDTNDSFCDKLISYSKLNSHSVSCAVCGTLILPTLLKSKKLSVSKTCSPACKTKLQSINGKETQNRLIAEGKHVGWKSRNIRSYAEKFWENVLNKNNIQFISEYHVNNKYFLDFYIEHNGVKIDLEIDGKQHKYVDRKIHDIDRDTYLQNIGYMIYRVDWNSINTTQGKNAMQNKINKFIDFYNKL